MKAFSPWTALYFIICVMIGTWFLINLTLAIIKTKFGEAQEEANKRKKVFKKVKV